MNVTETTVRSILTRTSGYLDEVASHSLQPYRGCAYGQSLCGVGCYAQHNQFVRKGRPWGGFLEVRTNAAETYLTHYEREQRWARRRPWGQFVIFCSSVTDPFVPQERRFHITGGLLEAMRHRPPDGLILQTHSHRVTDEIERIAALAEHCRVRVHLSIETDRERLGDLPPPASPVERRFEAARRLHGEGITTIVTVAPLLPIADPRRFFARIAEVADAVILDHFIGGDGSPDGARTARTGLPRAMAEVEPASLQLDYREEMVAIASEVMPGRVGVGRAGFAGEFE